MLLSDQRAAVTAACQALTGSGLLRGTSGNISTRDASSGLIAITPTGVGYSTMTSADIAVLELAGSQVDGYFKPTSEVALHLGIYRTRPDVMAVVHTHSMFATVFAALGEEIPAVHYLLARAGEAVPIAPYSRYGTEELAVACVESLGAGAAVLLANHGMVGVGSSLEAAIVVAEAVEFTAELAWRAHQLGEPKVLTQAQLAQARAAFASYGPTAAVED